MSPPHPGMMVIGVGNGYRGDDGAGIAVARRLRALFPTGVTILEESGEGGALMEAWRGASWVMLVDAVRSGAPPGTIHRFDARAAALPAGFFHYSTHAFSVAEAVELARSLNELPTNLVVYGIEGGNFVAGNELSVGVKRAVEAVAERVAQEIAAFRG